MLCHYANKSCDHKHYDCGDIMFLICHVTSSKHMFKGLCEFMGRSPSLKVTIFSMLDGHWSSASGVIKYLTCQVTLQNHVIEGSWYTTSLPSLAAINIVIVDI